MPTLHQNELPHRITDPELPKRDKTYSFRCPRELKKEARVLAAQLDMSMEGLCVTALRKFIEENSERAA